MIRTLPGKGYAAAARGQGGAQRVRGQRARGAGSRAAGQGARHRVREGDSGRVGPRGEGAVRD